MRKLRTNGNLEAAINDYLNSPLKVLEIAKKHKISVQKLSAWIEASGIPRRSRGRVHLERPSEHSQRILDYAAAHGFSQAALQFNISKQAVSSLAKRWAVAPPTRLSQANHNGTEQRDKPSRNPSRELDFQPYQTPSRSANRTFARYGGNRSIDTYYWPPPSWA